MGCSSLERRPHLAREFLARESTQDLVKGGGMSARIGVQVCHQLLAGGSHKLRGKRQVANGGISTVV